MGILDLSNCRLCPNECGVNRFKGKGKCHAGAQIIAARAALHFYEEPPISGNNGSGTIFFSGCSMQCCYCQNYDISQDLVGNQITLQTLTEIFRRLEQQGAENINLVSPTHFVPQIIQALDIYRPNIPIVYNTSGYEKSQLIYALKGYIDVYLTDLKYIDGKISTELSQSPYYFEHADKAIRAMIDCVGLPKFDKNGVLQNGVIIRHLVLPNYIQNSIDVLNHIAKNYKNEVLTSIMSQFTPISSRGQLNRPLKPLEYKIILKKAAELAIENGYIQELDSAKKDFIPKFDGFGIIN